jgi:hypothetical protein
MKPKGVEPAPLRCEVGKALSKGFRGRSKNFPLQYGPLVTISHATATLMLHSTGAGTTTE